LDLLDNVFYNEIDPVEAVALAEPVAKSLLTISNEELTDKVHLRLGAMYVDAGRFEDAIVQLEPLLPRTPPRGEQSEEWLLRFLTRAYAGAGRTDDARRTGQELIEYCMRWTEQPDAPALAWNQYACSLMLVTPPDLHDPAEALRAAERAIELTGVDDANYANFLDTLAMACHRTGDTRRAVELQRKAVEIATGPKGSPGKRRPYEERLAEYEAALSNAEQPDESNR
jgi:tetratricopeptide (TPR) repeat protein